MDEPGLSDLVKVSTTEPLRRPMAPTVPVIITTAVMGTIVALVASSFPFDPIGRQIVWLGSSFTLTAACVAYVIQNGRRTAWDEEQYQAMLDRRDDRP